MDYFYSHGLISIELYNRGRQVCGDKGVANCVYGGGVCTPECLATLEESIASSEWENAGDLNQYYIFGDVCKLQNKQAHTLLDKSIRPLTHRGVVGPCQDMYTVAYLQLAAVQDAIHVAVHTEWSDCSDNVSTHYTRSASALPKYSTILQAGLKGLIYSGDADSNVNFLGTERWLTTQGLNLTVREKWQSWFGPDKQLAGYSTRYTNLTFMTIKGAGHMVPATRPLHALYMFECFVYGDHQCATFTYPKDALEYLSGADSSMAPADGYVWWVVGSLVGIVALALLGWRLYVNQFSQYTELETKPIAASS
ncbi:hypothetical protein H310_13608 [Aphanomyces invadans]|uniref:Uncharacterized protein n=1 Tax=Aphanomyces invadans TaxID=157072 RepID=A0A024TD97_9STRA|nr:hypothetical protein H310_13608 [Aphanomyces invadans]ETV91959.1 hypothetical protein H310_13608 [Aphanomyces invadans]|eukprot:XP_008879383.1 hypothetical protein H310_13608 [Aphanomyces invadans]